MNRNSLPGLLELPVLLEKQTSTKEHKNKITKYSGSQCQVFGEDSKPRFDMVYYPIKKLSIYLFPSSLHGSVLFLPKVKGLCHTAEEGLGAPIVCQTPSCFVPTTTLQGRHCYSRFAGKEAQTLSSGLRLHGICSGGSWRAREGLTDSDVLSPSLSPWEGAPILLRRLYGPHCNNSNNRSSRRSHQSPFLAEPTK